MGLKNDMSSMRSIERNKIASEKDQSRERKRETEEIFPLSVLNGFIVSVQFSPSTLLEEVFFCERRLLVTNIT